MNPETAKRLRLLASAVSLIALLTLVFFGWVYWRVRASLPQLDGTVQVRGLSAPVMIERDALGVPTIRGANRVDVSRALGWLHGQDRFFQIDVLRRLAAGELAELVGKRGLPRDRAIRMHGFRRLAQTVLARMPAEKRAIVEAYAEGVNAGLRALREKPFEYLGLRDEPRPWLPEDSILVAYAMAIDLKDELGNYERTLMTIRDHYGLEGLAFFAPVVTPVDAALDGSTGPLAPIPGPSIINLRQERTGEARRAPKVHSLARDAPGFREYPERDGEFVPGSNAFALSGEFTASGSAMLANDMHLDHGVPNTWYRASLEYEGRKITGVTLPGTPVVVVGSNGSVAWGFTNATVDSADLVEVEVNSVARTLYQAPGHDEYLRIEQRQETIRVKGEKDVVVDYEWTIWGPIVGENERGMPLAHRMVVHDPDAINLNLLDMEGAKTAADAVRIAHSAGMPEQNIIIADKHGDIAWTIAGRLPKRVGYDGRLPVSWTYGDRKWNGYLKPEEVPTIYGKQSVLPGRLWSANNRHVGGEAMALLGDGGFRRAPRAAQIRDLLAPLQKATPRDLLAIQLNHDAIFLERWHKLMMQTLTPEVTAARKPRATLREFAEKWEGRASIDAVSYRLVREFRSWVFERVFTPIFEPCVEDFPNFTRGDLQLEEALWAILQERPMHLLSTEYKSWDDLLVAAIDDVITEIDRGGVKLPKANWGWRNRANIRHPFSYTFPWLSQWLNMPQDPLPGDTDMPRVQSPGHGASERLVVSPGREEEGIFHMPCGQSAHPMSPFYRAGHDAWVRGDPTPFLPGPTQHTLTLQP